MERLLQSPESTTHQGKAKLTPKTTLDSLYISILQGGFEDDDPENDSKICSVLGAIVLATNPLSPSTIATLLGFHITYVSLQLSSVHSLVLLGDSNHPVQPFHKSFPDFITDLDRCIHQRFYVSPPYYHHELLKGCLELMNQTLEKNMCKLQDTTINSEVTDLKERTKQYIDPALEYACRSWHKHLVNEHTVYTATISAAIGDFLRKKFLFWLEVLSILGAAREAVNALGVVIKWVEVCKIIIFSILCTQTHFQASPTLDLVNDCLCFVTRFFEAINASAPHIYHSALPLCPRTSLVWGLYEPYANPFVRLVHGTPNSWDLHAATFKCNDKINNIAWSPCSRFIAVTFCSYSEIQILDAVTLDQLFTMSPIISRISIGFYESDENGYLSFSPNGHVLTYCKWGCICSWDLQTGGLICHMKINYFDYDSKARLYLCPKPIIYSDPYPKSLISSECGAMVGFCSLSWVFLSSTHATLSLVQILLPIHLEQESYIFGLMENTFNLLLLRIIALPYGKLHLLLKTHQQ